MVKTFCPKLHLLLVGAFSFQRKIPDCSSDLFFLQITDLTLKGPLFTETTKTTKAKSGQQKLSPKGPFFHFLLFRGNLQNRTSLKGPPFDFFSALCDIFRKKKISKISSFFHKNVLRFSSLEYSADFRRSRLVLFSSDQTIFAI